jgi:glyoxylase-like metal-dependent hydrolase (beta-lactamase superfamily II)
VPGEESAALVDTGTPGTERKLSAALERLGIAPDDVRCIVATHSHYDHVGSLRAIKQLTGAAVVMHKHDAGAAAAGRSRTPPGSTGWGRVLGFLMRLFRVPEEFAAVRPDLTMDAEMSLEPFGIPGRVLHTPGHTRGSVSVVLAGGEALVGDLAMSGFPLRTRPGIPVFAESVPDIYESWERLLAAGATTIYPAHGRPFPADRLRDLLARRAR